MADVIKEYVAKIAAIKALQVKRRGRSAKIDIAVESNDPKLQLKELRQIESQLRIIR